MQPVGDLVLPCNTIRMLVSHASAEVRGENMPERNFASSGSRTHNHQVMSPDRLTTEPSRWGL